MRRIGNIIGNSILGLVVAGMVSLAVYGIYDSIKRDRVRNEAIKILDANQDGNLSEDESKRFFDEIKGRNLYLTYFNNAGRKELERFVSDYIPVQTYEKREQ